MAPAHLMAAPVQQFVNYFMPESRPLANPNVWLVMTQGLGPVLELLRAAFPVLQVPQVDQGEPIRAQKLANYYLRLLKIDPSDRDRRLENIFVAFVTARLRDGIVALLGFYNSKLAAYQLELNFGLDSFLTGRATDLRGLEAASFRPLLEDRAFAADFYDFRLFCYLFGDVSANVAQYQRLAAGQERLAFVFRLLQTNDVTIVVPREYLYGLCQPDSVLWYYLFVWQHLIVADWFAGGHGATEQKAGAPEPPLGPLGLSCAHPIAHVQQSQDADPELRQLDTFIRSARFCMRRSSTGERPALTRVQTTNAQGRRRNVFLENRGVHFSKAGAPRAAVDRSFNIHVEEVPRTPVMVEIEVQEEDIERRQNAADALNLSCIQRASKVSIPADDEPDPFQELQQDLAGQAQLQEHDEPVRVLASPDTINPSFGAHRFEPESLQTSVSSAVQVVECSHCQLVYLVDRQHSARVGLRIRYLVEISQVEVQVLQRRKPVLEFASAQIVNVNGADAQQTLKFMFRGDKEVWVVVGDGDAYRRMCAVLREARKML